MTPKYTVRVYGILIHGNRVLLCSEYKAGMHFTKFPGGGLEPGEGTLNTLRREFMEELNLSIEVLGHFYTTDFYVASAFDPELQVMSIYYRVAVNPELLDNIGTVPLSADTNQEGKELFHWIALEDLSTDMVTFPVEKHVVTLLTQEAL